MAAEALETKATVLQLVSLDTLCILLKYVLQRMKLPEVFQIRFPINLYNFTYILIAYYRPSLSIFLLIVPVFPHILILSFILWTLQQLREYLIISIFDKCCLLSVNLLQYNCDY